MLEIHLLRHAQSAHNDTASHLVCGRSSDVPLSAKGIAQAEAVGDILDAQGIHFDKVFCSTAVRTRQTLNIAQSRAPALRATPVVLSEQIEERAQGEWVGKCGAEIYTQKVVAKMHDDLMDFKAPGGESYREAEARMMNFLRKEILQQYENGTILIVGHATVFRCMLMGLFQFPPEVLIHIAYKNAFFSKLTFDKQTGWKLRYCNQPWPL
jgi:probable phosphoglycerate mutase